MFTVFFKAWRFEDAFEPSVICKDFIIIENAEAYAERASACIDCYQHKADVMDSYTGEIVATYVDGVRQ